MTHIPEELLRACLEHGARAYPEEACGFLSGPAGEGAPRAADRAHPMANRMDERHAQDPAAFPRTNRNAYLIDPREQMKLERELKREGRRVLAIYHSHPDVGAYFSETDRRDAMWNGDARYPGVDYLVCGVSAGGPDGAILAVFDEAARDFVVHAVPLPGPG